MRKKRDETLRTEAVAGANGAEDGVDVDAGIVVVDDTPPEQTINTSEILRTGDDLGGVTASGALPGKVFILDIGPIFKLLEVKPKDRPGHNLGRFCDNLLARSVARLGTYEAHGADLFLFRLNMADDRALRAAIAIVNEAGKFFLRDGFQAEKLVPHMVDAVDAAEATNADGSINVERALDAQSRRRRAAEDQRQAKAAKVLAPGTNPQPLFEQKPKPPPPEPEWIAVKGTDRPAGMRVKRSPERRGKFAKPIAGTDRQIIANGRRQSDDPKIQAW
jgi:hypothetical protein